jgi:hypothetical protein
MNQTMANQKLLLRAAEGIRGCLHQAQTQSVEIQLPDYHWTKCQTILRRIRLARSREWHYAATALTESLRYPLCQCLQQLNELCNRSLSGRPSKTVATVRDIFADLEAIFDEFDDLSIDLQDAVLSVTTAPIVLEGILLGRFRVRLHWGWIGRAHPYEVLALEPNPASSSESTTHPHIVDERLCEGDGKMPIARALHQGRLFDFFQIVNRVRNTYNPSSAYVALSDWEGSGCSDCGEIVDPDDERTCDTCEDTLCGNCALTCERCEAPCCYECSRRCESCGQWVERSRTSNRGRLPPRPNRRTSEANRLPFDRSGALFRHCGRSSGERPSNGGATRTWIFSYWGGVKNSRRTEKTQTRKPQSRRVSGNLISDMRIPECKSLGSPRLGSR